MRVWTGEPFDSEAKVAPTTGQWLQLNHRLDYDRQVMNAKDGLCWRDVSTGNTHEGHAQRVDTQPAEPLTETA